MNFSNAKQSPSPAKSRSLQAWAWTLTLSAAAALLVMGSAHAQNPETTAVAAEAPAPRYTASKLALAFNYIDGDRDGKLSQEEAAGFRGVARHFDEADADQDNFLSRAEFDAAMNHVKPQ